MQLIECVANVSEGRNPKVLQCLCDAIQEVSKVRLLDRHSDPDHHRSVLTFAGPPEAVTEAAFRLTQEALGAIDLTVHQGEHPRIGAVDVLPLTPLQTGSTVTMEECVHWAHHLGARLGRVLHLPVFLYEEACQVPSRRHLEVIRRGGLRGLTQRMHSEPEWIPDFGPSQPHPTAGATVVGARGFLIAFNIVLQTSELSVAQAIAKSIRSSGGGLPALKAIGVKLERRDLVQVSMNLTNFRITSLQTVFDAVEALARSCGVPILESELVGLLPLEAVPDDPMTCLKCPAWNPDQVLETRLAREGLLP